MKSLIPDGGFIEVWMYVLNIEKDIYFLIWVNIYESGIETCLMWKYVSNRKLHINSKDVLFTALLLF